MEENRQALSEAAAALRSDAEQIMQQAGRVLGETLPPAKPAEQIAADRRATDEAAARQSPEFKRRQAGLARRRHTAELLRRTTRRDYHEKAAEIDAEIAEAVEGEAAFLETVIEKMREQRDAIRSNANRLDRAESSKRAGHPEEFTIVLLQTYKATCRIIAEHWPFLSEFGYTPGEENR